MPEHILDTGVLIRHLRDYQGYPEMVNRLSGEGDVFISAMTRLEIVRGMRNRELDATFYLLNSLVTMDVTSWVADQAGEIIRSWKTRGITFGDADALIAATAIHHGLTLVTTNPKHFPNPELTVLQADDEGNLSPYEAGSR